MATPKRRFGNVFSPPVSPARRQVAEPRAARPPEWASALFLPRLLPRGSIEALPNTSAGAGDHAGTMRSTTCQLLMAALATVAAVAIMGYRGLPSSETFWTAVMCGHADQVGRHLRWGADANVRTRDGTPLLLYVALGRESHLSLLSPRSGGDAADEAIIRVLLAHGADANVKSRGQRTALHIAADRGHKGMAELLISHGADVNARKDSGHTPLHWAALGGHLGVVTLLLANGADANARSQTGWTPLHDAAALGHGDVARILLDRGADVNAARLTGWTPLHEAAALGQADIVEMFIASGAEIGATDSANRTALDYATGNAAASVLRRHRAKD